MGKLRTMKTKTGFLTSSIIVIVLALLATACGSGGNSSGSAASRFSDIPTPSTLDINDLSTEDEALLNALVSHSEQLVDETSETVIRIVNYPTAPRDELNNYARCQAEAIFQGIGGAEGAREYGLTPERVQDGTVTNWLDLYDGAINDGENGIELPQEIVEKVFILFQRNCPEAYEFRELFTASTFQFIFAETLDFTDTKCNLLDSATQIVYVSKFYIETDEVVEGTEEEIQLSTEFLEGVNSCLKPRESVEANIISKFSWVKWDSCPAAASVLEIYFDYRYLVTSTLLMGIQEAGRLNPQAPDNPALQAEIEQVGAPLAESLRKLYQECINFEELADRNGVEANQLIRQKEVCLTFQTSIYISIFDIIIGLDRHLGRVSDILTKDNCDGISEEITEVLGDEFEGI